MKVEVRFRGWPGSGPGWREGKGRSPRGLLGAFLLCAAPAFASGWTLEATLARAREAAPEVRIAAAQVAEAEASRVGQGVFLPTNPRVYGDYRRLGATDQGGLANGFSAGLEALFEVSGASGSRLEEAERRVGLARAALGLERARAQGRAWASWVEAQLAAQRVRLFEDALEVQVRVELAARERLSAGVAGEPELASVLLELATVRVQLAEARRQAATTLLSLGQSLDLPHDEALHGADAGRLSGDLEGHARGLATASGAGRGRHRGGLGACEHLASPGAAAPMTRARPAGTEGSQSAWPAASGRVATA